jgi:hypothetical protein
MSTIAGLKDVFTGLVLLSLDAWTWSTIFNLLYIRELYWSLSALLCVVLSCVRESLAA